MINREEWVKGGCLTVWLIQFINERLQLVALSASLPMSEQIRILQDGIQNRQQEIHRIADILAKHAREEETLRSLAKVLITRN